VTARAPAWVKLRGDRKEFDLVPKKAEVVRRIFRMADDGYGIKAIARKLNEERVACIGRGATWHASYVRMLLTSRSAIGEYQSYTGKGKHAKPFGKPIPGYFPALVPEALFYRVQQAMQKRKRKVGPRGACVTNLFSGLLRDARDGGPLVICPKTNGTRVLASSNAMRGVGTAVYVSFPYEQFEAAILQHLSEVRPEDVAPKTRNDDSHNRIEHWSGKVSELDLKIEKTRERIDREPDIEVYLDLLANLERQRREAATELDRAKQDGAAPNTKSLGDVRTLAKLLKEAEPEDREGLRSRLRAKVADVVEEMVCLLTTARVSGSRGRAYQARAAVVQIQFRGEPRRVRHYLIVTNPRTGWCESRSFTAAKEPATIDISKRTDAAKVQKMLSELDRD
jgi:hypothetical protein